MDCGVFASKFKYTRIGYKWRVVAKHRLQQLKLIDVFTPSENEAFKKIAAKSGGTKKIANLKDFVEYKKGDVSLVVDKNNGKK